MTTITLRQAIELVEEAVRDAQVKYGKDVTYHDVDQAFTLGSGVTCRYFLPSGHPACLVGQLLAKKGVRSFYVSGFNKHPFFSPGLRTYLYGQFHLDFTQEAALYLVRVQERQDNGETWADAARLAKSAMREDGYPVDGDIGEPLKEIELEPIPATEPVPEKTPQVVPEPEQVPA